jgi:hypothetical protein
MDERTKAIVSTLAVLAVQILALCGVKVETNSFVSAVAVIASVIASIYACWKNHNFTDEAARAQELLDNLKGKNDA